ncbi:MAG TPA: hypothetical protein VKP58_01755 [Candidatus Acidoferrum sp.]|nr:hypothetical protein [Candidatus Acidoferrum sp.]
MKQPILPDKVLRGIALFSLVAMGAAMIYRAKHIGPQLQYGAQLFDTVGYFFFAFLLFGLFYGQYVWIPRLLRRPLNLALGFVQAFLCLALLLLGILPVWVSDMSASPKFTADNMAITIAILGEALFVANICWTLLQPATAAVPLSMAPPKAIEPAPRQAELHPAARLQAEKRFKFDVSRWLKPENAAEKFGVTWIFLFAGGGLIWLALPESRFLVLFGGQKHFVPMGILWWICAVPFGIFSLAYWLLAGRRSVPYDKWMTKVHLGVTFAWLIDFVRIVILAQWSLTSRLPDLLMDNYTFELYLLLGASIALFFLNVRATARAAIK